MPCRGTLLTSLLVLLLVYSSHEQARKSNIVLDNNGFDNVVIGIHPDVKKDMQLIENIKSKFKEASEVLYRATFKRAFFRSIIIVQPSTWSGATTSSSNFNLYQDADVVIEPDTVGVVYTQMYKGCGQQGSHIRMYASLFLNPMQERNFGPIAKLIVHEWGHFRWGLFNEFNSGPYDTYFRNPMTGLTEATRCSKKVTGRHFLVRNGGAVGYCYPDPVTKEFDKDCVFQPYTGRFATVKNRGVRASFMDRPIADNIEVFCQSQTIPASIPEGDLHYEEAPTTQNRVCGGQSTMEVILQSEDFTDPSTKVPGSLNPPRVVPFVDLDPKFTVEQAGLFHHVVALDTASLMNSGSLAHKVRRSVDVFLTTLPENTLVGVVGSHTQEPLHPFSSSVSLAERKKIISSTSPPANGRDHDIDGLLRNALRMIPKHGLSHKTATIRVTTNRSRSYNITAETLQLLKSSNAKVDAVVLGDYVADDLIKILQSTGGRLYHDENEETTNLEDSVHDLVGKENANKFVLTREKQQLSGFEQATAPVWLDKAVRGGLAVTAVYRGAAQAPRVCLLARDQDEHLSEGNCRSEETQIIHCFFSSELLQAGQVAVVTENTGPNDISVALTVASMRTKPTSQPLHLTSWLGDLSVTKTGSCIGVYAEATKVLQPVVKLTVIAYIQTPNKGDPVQLQLLDEGTGYDIEANDGVYSRAFCGMKLKGLYSVSVRADNRLFEAKIKRKTMQDTSQTIKASASLAARFARYGEPVTRVATAGSFNFRPQAPVPKTDVVLPGQITDAVLTKIVVANRSVSIAWSAPGDDEDNGIVHHYEVATSEWSGQLRTNFANCLQVRSTQVLEGSLVRPLKAGSRETLTFQVLENSVVRYLAIRAVDEQGNRGHVSNIVPVGYNNLTDYYLPTIASNNDLEEDYMKDEELLFSSTPVDATHQKAAMTYVAPVTAAFVSMLLVASVIGVILQRRKRRRLLSSDLKA